MFSEVGMPGIGIGKGRGILMSKTTNIHTMKGNGFEVGFVGKSFSERNEDKENIGMADVTHKPKVYEAKSPVSTVFVKSSGETDYQSRPPRVSYVPDDDADFNQQRVDSGVNFDKFNRVKTKVTGEKAPDRISSLTDVDLPSFLRENVKLTGYNLLTPVQKYVIPIILAGRDVAACAETGSGKTAAFLIPIIARISSLGNLVQSNEVDSKRNIPQGGLNTPRCIVIAPTRELCRQTFLVASSLCIRSNLRCAYGYGGVEMLSSIHKVSKCDLLCATPGRLAQYLNSGVVSLNNLDHVVCDEADQLLNLENFLDVVTLLLRTGRDICGRRLQVSMFSATFPQSIQSMMERLMIDYLFVAVGAVGAANSDISQAVIEVTATTKLDATLAYIGSHHDIGKTIIFVNKKRLADFYGIRLIEMGLSVTTIHGDRLQADREIALNLFRKDEVQVLVATDVASRGLDIPHVDTVINVDMPSSVDVYVHRIGRCGRLGNPGAAVTFLEVSKDGHLAPRLLRVLRGSGQPCPPFLERSAASGSLIEGDGPPEVLRAPSTFMNQGEEEDGDEDQ